MRTGAPTGMAEFWLRWVVANAVGEVLGLGPVALIALMLARVLAETGGAAAALMGLLLFTALGAFEGAVVGYAQGRVLRRRLPAVTARRWTAATAIGASAAWFLGMLPATVGALSGGEAAMAESELGAASMIAMEAATGAVLGAVLAVPQWRVLRRHVDRAGWWLPANAVAWAAAIPLIFLVASADLPAVGLLLLCATIVTVIAGAGALVGAIHGLVLVRLLAAAQGSGPDQT